MKKFVKASADALRKQGTTKVGTAAYGQINPKADLLKAICGSPDDDVFRLSYARALRLDDPRREFIVAQLAMASFPYGATDPEYLRAASASTGLIVSHHDEWRPDWAPEVSRRVDEYGFWRGFVELVQMSGEAFLEVGDRLRPYAPILHLDLLSTAGLWGELSSRPELGPIRSIALNDNDLTDGDILALAQSPYLYDLRWLSLTNNTKVSREGVEALASHSNSSLRSLRYVSLQGTDCNPIEQYAADGDYITSTWLPDEGVQLEQKYGLLPWLHRNTARRSLIPPRRFTISASESSVTGNASMNTAYLEFLSQPEAR